MSLSVHVSSRSSLRRRVISSLPVAGFLLVSALGMFGCNSTEPPPPPPRTPPVVRVSPGRPTTSQPTLSTLPANVLGAELRAVSGKPIKLSNYSGKVLLVNLWATWCGPCRMETPELVRLHQEYRQQGLEIVGLSTENPEVSEEMVKEFVRDYAVNYRVGWATREVALELMQGRDAIPQSFVISRSGQVMKRFIGFNISSTPPQLKQAIEEALKS
jgi:thiol-disulfide isomerase/thioredoxin